MYKLLVSELGTESVLKIEENLFIPFDEANTDYQEYLAWVAEGNTPEPADEIEE